MVKYISVYRMEFSFSYNTSNILIAVVITLFLSLITAFAGEMTK